jgi:hypothetical protein
MGVNRQKEGKGAEVLKQSALILSMGVRTTYKCGYFSTQSRQEAKVQRGYLFKEKLCVFAPLRLCVKFLSNLFVQSLSNYSFLRWRFLIKKANATVPKKEMSAKIMATSRKKESAEKRA